MSDDETPPDYEITQDNVTNEPGTGVEAARQLVVARHGSGSRKAVFEFDAESRVYRLQEYTNTSTAMFAGGIAFTQADVDTLAYLERYLRETRENADVELFVGQEDDDIFPDEVSDDV